MPSGTRGREEQIVKNVQFSGGAGADNGSGGAPPQNLYLVAALDYVQRLSWPVFPSHSVDDTGNCSCRMPDCSSPGKHPRTQKGFKDATIDETTIRGWWEMWPDANVAVPTGESSGFDALDVDPRHSGTDSLDQMEAEHGSLPDTIEQITGSGGRHILFRHHDGVGNKIALAPGLDVRGDGGYIIVPPSRHVSGRTYEWELSGLPGEIPMAEWPDWFVKILESSNGASSSKVSETRLWPAWPGRCGVGVCKSLRLLPRCQPSTSTGSAPPLRRRR